MQIIKIKNIQDSSDTYCGQVIDSGEYYTIQNIQEATKFAQDDKVNQHLWSDPAKILISNGIQDFTDKNIGDNWLKGNSNRDSSGNPIIAPTFEYDEDLNGVWQGFKYIATAGVLNIYDEVVTTELKLRGGWYEILDITTKAVDGDYIEFAIIDKDDVLGLFSTYGLTVGVDILELSKFVRTDYINLNSNHRQEFTSNAASNIVAGLYFRIYYNSIGQDDVNFKIVLKYHEG